MVKQFGQRTSPRPSGWLSRLTLIVAAAAAASACGSHTTGGSSTSSPTSAAGGVKTVNVTMANDSGADGCKLDTNNVPAGPVTFTVKNASAAGITEMELLKDQRIIGEKENLAPGLDPVSFTVTLDGGAYQVYCPGAGTEYQNFTVTGQAPAAPTGTVANILTQGTKDYAAYVVGQINQLNDGVKSLDAAIQSGNVQAPRRRMRRLGPSTKEPNQVWKASSFPASLSTTTPGTSIT